jgi:hypothetical protein
MPLSSIEAARAALAPTGAASEVIREISNLPPAAEIKVDAHEVIAALRNGLQMLEHDIAMIVPETDHNRKHQANALAEVRAALRNAQSLRVANG